MEMNNDATNSPTSTETSDSDAVNCSTARVYFGPVQSPEKRLIANSVARKYAALDSPLHPSDLLTLPVLPSSKEVDDTPDEANERSDEDASEVSVAAHLSRDDTPENDPLCQDEPSSVLASRIMRASDNPSPPPHAHPTTYFNLVMKDGRNPIPDISAPPSPFRPINLHERLDQFTASERVLSPDTLASQASNEQYLLTQDSGGNISQPDLISFESCSALVETLSKEPITHLCGSSVQILPPDATSSIDDLLAQSPERPPVMPSPRVDAIEQSKSSDSLDELRQGCVPVDAESGVSHPSSLPSIANSSALDITKERTRTPVRRSPRLSMTPRSFQNTHAPQPPESSRRKGNPSMARLLPEGENHTMPEEQHVGDNGNADPSPIIQRSPEEKERRSRRRGLSGRLDTPNLKRELGSLSPQSADVLARLLPAEGSTLPTEGQSSQPHAPPSTPQRPNSISQYSNFSLTATPLFIAPTPIHSNGRLVGPSSPLKFSVTADDASRTPARRVPIQDAFAQGSASARNAMLLSAKRDATTRLTMRGPVFSRPALDDAPRSPAKRVLISELTTPVCSPTRPAVSRARSASVEPKPIFPQPIRSRSVDPSPQTFRFINSKGKDPMFPKLSSKPISGAKLPFPLVASRKAGTDLPHSIPEEAEKPETPGEALVIGEVAPSSSPVKSSLKKPSTSSRIPKISAKPYARPQPKKVVSSATTKLPAFNTAPRAPPFKVTPAGSSSSDESCALAPPPNRKMESNSMAESSVLSTLKRKRGVEETVKSPVTRAVMIRQVVPGMLGPKYTPKVVPELPTPAPPLPEPSPRKPPGPMKFRKVEPGVISARYAATSKQAEFDSLPPIDDGSRPQLLVQPEAPDTRPPPPSDSTVLHASPEREPPEPSHNVFEPHQTIADPPSHQSTENRSWTRRASRRKPAAQHANDVFDTSAPVQPLRLRRSRRSGDEGFLGMSAVALQALTNSNTTKNQQVFSKLEREIIRKEGVRPESPIPKVRTILQKQREARDRQRHERAERRARRSEDGLSDTEGASELGDQSMISTVVEHDENEGVVTTKHRRGPGEVEDYETPEKPDRAAKRLRFGNESHEEARENKRVKWHRGLSTEIYLDEVQPRPSQSKNVVIEKSCLAPTSKGLRLDTLGNLVDIEQHPLTDIDPENIVVKKYVYDSDIEVVKEAVPPKITRSRSKKLKS